MSNYNVTRFFRSTRHPLKGGSISFFLQKFFRFCPRDVSMRERERDRERDRNRDRES